MIGTRAMSGSAARRFRNVLMAGPSQEALVHVDVEDLARPRLLPRDLQGLGVLPAATSFANFGSP